LGNKLLRRCGWCDFVYKFNVPCAFVQIDEPFDLETFTVPLREWIMQEQTQAEIKRRFVSVCMPLRW
jgi:hypothetical protein